MFPPVDTKNPAAVAAFVEARFLAHFPGESPARLRQMFRDVEALFTGRHPDYGPIDLRYHDLEHTLQASVCLALLLEGCRQAGETDAITARRFEFAIAAALLHDSGYLKLRSDSAGTGAKYTYCHVLRSCAFAASYLPVLGATEAEIAGVLGAINCTGPAQEAHGLHFSNATERFIGCALATADYLGQMAALDYPDELEILYAEFSESDDYLHVPPAQRAFASPEDLIARTPAFWRKVVRPKLDDEFLGAHRYLATPYPNGRNAYLEAVERNITLIEARAAHLPRRVA
ncbi:hypothetical protein [Opitutus terrae]|uniref:HD/PDEase domain-containing protein n=1 Tax=Opitutus terrae (strain DSM 11246 / JCM 15787 / PB90-1) TaxID=452637 RepID=B1ZZF7_OPITP|nr:hypothetical protein [Opitutus terrae]ACB76360.1 conserved hypothetical protein [Opitutus terrae PB90-1]